MIEVGTRTNTQLSKEDAEFYCFCLGDGWRLATADEFYSMLGSIIGCYDSFSDPNTVKLFFTPVRDLKDD
jgi:hypothetical protein